jgi:hypothetical protein
VRTGGTEVLGGLAVRFGAAQQQRVLAGRRAQSELVEGQALAASLRNPGTGGLREPQRANSHLRHVKHTHIVRHRADHDSDLVARLLFVHELLELRNGHRRPVRPRHEQACDDGGAER